MSCLFWSKGMSKLNLVKCASHAETHTLNSASFEIFGWVPLKGLLYLEHYLGQAQQKVQRMQKNISILNQQKFLINPKGTANRLALQFEDHKNQLIFD